MYDYMKALQKRFDHQEHSELDKQVEYAQEELRRDMDAMGRGKLLRLVDAQNALLVEAKLMSFTAGFKLAAGIAGELGTPYSFDADEEEKATARATFASAQTVAGRVATQRATTPKPESASSKTCWVRRRRNARRSSVPQWRLPEESTSAALMSTR